MSWKDRTENAQMRRWQRWHSGGSRLASFIIYVRSLLCPLHTHITQMGLTLACLSLPYHLERWVAFFLLGQIHFPEVWCQYNLPLKAREQDWTIGNDIGVCRRGVLPSPSLLYQIQEQSRAALAAEFVFHFDLNGNSAMPQASNV